MSATKLAQSTDSVSEITRGNPLSLLRWLSGRGLTVNSFSAVWEENGRPRCFGRVWQAEGDVFSRLDYVACAKDTSPDDLTCLLEALIRVSGTWGARYLLADIPESSDYLPAFRRTDFTVWSQAKIYRYRGNLEKGKRGEAPWRQWTDRDVWAMQTLQRSAVPKLFQTIEPLSRKLAQGLVAYDPQGRLLGFADLAYGPNGTWLQPILDREADPASLLLSLAQTAPTFLGKPVFLSARSYQPLLSEALEQLPFSLERELALMVRHLTLKDKVPVPAWQPVYEGEKTEGSVPVIQSRQNSSK